MQVNGFLYSVSAVAMAAFCATAAAAQVQSDPAASPAPAVQQQSPTQATGSGPAVEPATPTTTDADQAPSGDIIVTALRRSETVLKVPAALTAIQGDDLKTRGVNSVTDLQNLVPGVNISTSQDGVVVGIRGVQTTDTSSKGEQDVAFNIDGQYVGRGNARTTAFFDLDRVEILRGPQGTLYGRSSTGGAINLITAKPRLSEFSGYGRLEYGNYNAKRAEGAINIPLGDLLAFRFAGNVNDRDGYSKPVGYTTVVNNQTVAVSPSGVDRRNDQKDATGRASLLFQPSSNLTARVTATFGEQRGNGGANQLDSLLHDGSGADRLRVLANPIDAFVRNSFFNIDGSINARLGAVQVDLLGSHQHFKLRQQRPYTYNAAIDGSFSTILQRGKANTSQAEIRLSNADSGRLDYVAGANYFKENVDENGHVFHAPFGSGTDTSTYGSFFQVKNTTPHKAYGFFAQGTFHFDDRLSAVAGVRYTHDEVSRSGYIALPPFVPIGCRVTYPNDCDGQGIPNSASASDHKITWKGGLNYQLDPSNLVYASIATGFKGGGFNDYDPASTRADGVGFYSPASITAYEFGYKGRPLTRLTLATSAFYYDFSKNQITAQLTFPVTNQTVIFTQTTPTEVWGIENEVSYRLGAHTTFSGSVAYQKSRFKNFLAGSLVGNQFSFSGLDLDQTPRFVAIGSVDHAFQLGGGAQLRLRGQVKYSDGYELSGYANAVRYHQNSFTRSDASITYAAAEDRYYVQLFVENIENRVQGTGLLNNDVGPYGGVNGSYELGPQPFGYLNYTTTPPRFYGVRVGFRY